MSPLSSAIIINQYMFISLLTVLAGSNVDVIHVFETSGAQEPKVKQVKVVFSNQPGLLMMSLPVKNL